MITKQTTTKTVTKEEFVELTCDACGNKAQYVCEIPDYTNWDHEEYRYATVIISYNSGCRYPDGAIGEKIIYDICGQCFEDKVMPFLDALCKDNKRTIDVYD